MCNQQERSAHADVLDYCLFFRSFGFKCSSWIQPTGVVGVVRVLVDGLLSCSKLSGASLTACRPRAALHFADVS